jgi:uncharacterized protein (TIGR02453 family)
VGKAGNGERAFSRELFTFLRDLREHNDREWFQANKPRYLDVVQEPALRFVAEFAQLLEGISRHFVADPRPVGGSLFRIYRDTRFSKDKTPYKTQVGIHFRHELAKSAHAPGFYLHLEPGSVFAAGGIWRPDTETLGRLRQAIAADPQGWAKATRAVTSGGFRLEGDALKRPPTGFDPAHPAIEELKRKDFIAVANLTERQVVEPRFANRLAELFRTTTPLMRFLCAAIDAPF